MPDHGFDDWMDAQLRKVPVPHDLEVRLRDISRPSADGLEPARPQLSPSDARIDRTIRSVETPRGLERRLRTISRPPMLAAWRRIPRDMWAAAASVLIFAGAGTLLAFWNTEQAPPALAQQEAAQPQEASPTPAQPPVQALAESKTPRPTASRPGAGAPKLQKPVTVALGEQPQPSAGLVDNMNAMGTALRRAIEAQQRAKFALGSSGQFEAVPALAAIEPHVARGITPPRVHGYDHLFQLRHTEHPMVIPAANKTLQVSRAPLTLQTSSYDRTTARVAAGRLPAKQEIRVEDFLAAQDYQLPAAQPGDVTLHAAVCPAPLSNHNRHLLQVIVQGAPLPRQERPATRLIAVVDISSAMNDNARAKQVTRALAKLGREMHENDRLTLIGYGEAPRVLLENASGKDLILLAASGGLEPSSTPGDLLSAIQAAADAVSELPRNETRRVLFIHAGRELDGVSQKMAQNSLAKLAASGIPWSIVELRGHGGESPWQDLAAAGGGQARICDSAEQLLALCLEALHGRSTCLAQDLSLRIHFNPKTVAGYRLLGHESATLTGEAGDPLEIDLHAGQTPTCIYELVINPPEQTKKGPAPLNLGTVEVTWRHPVTGQPQRQVQTLGQAHLAPSFATAPPWLQQGILAARTAESLKGGYFVANVRRIGQLLELVRQVDPQTARTPEFRELVRLIQQADRLR